LRASRIEWLVRQLESVSGTLPSAVTLTTVAAYNCREVLSTSASYGRQPQDKPHGLGQFVMAKLGVG